MDDEVLLTVKYITILYFVKEKTLNVKHLLQCPFLISIKMSP